MLCLIYVQNMRSSGLRLRCFVSFQALRSFKVTMSVDPKFHPKIIGRKGAVISQIRKDHDVNIQFPDKGDEEQVCCHGYHVDFKNPIEII